VGVCWTPPSCVQRSCPMAAPIEIKSVEQFESILQNEKGACRISSMSVSRVVYPILISVVPPHHLQ
jgi:hypothetical protein